MKILAIDYGTKHLGLAISEGILAEPYGKLDFKDNQELLANLVKICNKEKIEKIVIGLPQGSLVAIIKKFSQELFELTNLPIVFQDETLTSEDAKQKMVESGKPYKKRQSEEHIIASCLILQEYLDQ